MNNKTNIFALYINDINNHLYLALLDRVSLKKKQRAIKFRRLEDSISTMSGELLLRYGLMTTL